MGIRILYVFLFIQFLTGGGIVSADNSPRYDATQLTGTVTVEIAPTTAQPAIGDSLTIICTVTRPEGVSTGEPYTVEMSKGVSSLALIDISRQWNTTETTASKTIDRYGFLTYVFAPDTLRVGPFRVDYTTPEGEKAFAESNVLTFVVSGVVADPNSPPQPNRRPFGIASKGIPAWLIAALVLLAIFAALVIIYLIRRRKRAGIPKPEPEKPVDEIGEFERIRRLKLDESGRIKELYTLTSSAMRGFMHRNMGFEALYDTTEEILNHLERSPRPSDVTESIRDIFRESDMVKFAKLIPPADRTSTVIDRALAPVKKVLDEIEREKAARAAEEASEGKRQKVKAGEAS